MSHMVCHMLPTALSDAAVLVLSGVRIGYEFGLISTAATQ